MTENQQLCTVIRMVAHNIVVTMITAADPSPGIKKIHQLNDELYSNDEIQAVINKETSL